MAHPFAGHRQQSVERSRAAKIIGAGSPKGPGPVSAAKKFIRTVGKSPAMKVDGPKSSPRLDKYARGGGVKKGATNVNVIIAPQGGGAPPVVPPPPMAGPLPAPPMGPPGAPPMAQRRGGRAYATGGKVVDGPAWKEGLRDGTQVQHTDGKNDQSGLNRGRPITYATGGKIEAYGMGPKLTAGDNGEGRKQKAALQKRSKRA